MLYFIMSLLTFGPSEWILDFGKSEKRNLDWYVLTDQVMGGKSSSSLLWQEKSLIWKGYLSLENNGGFASIRSPFGNNNLYTYTSIIIKYRAKNQKFALVFETSDIWWQPHYKYEFHSAASEEWKITEIPLQDFHEEVIGRKTGKMIEKNQLNKILRIGIITNAKNETNFELEIDYIKFK
jgi:NADH dehydrogenase [ubiquinone] 1 alpha subcomplex assembly factor 1